MWVLLYTEQKKFHRNRSSDSQNRNGEEIANIARKSPKMASPSPRTCLRTKASIKDKKHRKVIDFSFSV